MSRNAVLEEAANIAANIDSGFECEKLGCVDPETGVRECALDTRGESCLCTERNETADKIADAIRACQSSADDQLEVTHVLEPGETLKRLGLSEADQNAIADAFAQALDNGGPGLSLSTRRAIIVSAMIRVRHALCGEL